MIIFQSKSVLTDTDDVIAWTERDTETSEIKVRRKYKKKSG